MVSKMREAYGELEEAYRQAVLSPIRLEMIKKLQRFFVLQQTLFLAAFAEYEKRFPIAEAVKGNETDIAISAVEKETADILKEIITIGTTKAMALGFKNISKKINIGIAFDLANPRAVQYLKDNAAAKVTNINEITREYLKTILTQGVEEG